MDSLVDGNHVIGRPRPAWPHRARAATAVIATAGVALLAAGCGGSAGAHVARLGSTATHGSSKASAASGADAFSRCMRSHRVPTYPDPATAGLLPKKTPQQLGVSSTTLQSAQGACIHLVPNGGQPSQALVQQYRHTMLAYARCIRTHGVPDMPDPDSRGHLDIGPGTAVSVDSPRFTAAFNECKSKLSP